MSRKKRRRQPPEPFEVVIENLSHEGRGIAHHNGKIVFVFAALPGERVIVQVNKTNKKYSEATVIEILEASPHRIEPHCAHFSVCGGCSMQHVSSAYQLELKQQSVLEMMDHAGINIGEVIPALTAESWGYRRKARLGAKYVIKKERLLVGFRERNKPYLADMQSCPILIDRVGQHLQDLMDLISGLDARQSIAQIEVAADDENCMLVFRHLEALSESDLDKLTQFAKQTGFWLQLQPGGADTVHALYPEQQILRFKPLADSEIAIRFKATDFTQVNAGINQQMVKQALDFLDIQSDDKILDLFCGLGNFTLPMAEKAAQVTGIEGDEIMVNRAKENALEQGITNTEYFASDLTDIDKTSSWMKQHYDKILLDPPRSGALEIVEQVKPMKASTIVYVSCQPSSLVRDSKVLCDAGYKMTHFGLMDMFPQTAHVESMAVFRK
ncbi:MAG: 23S rRNA (uracil(1939)-C(5))-methyltransferase RlmD [Gammaproteobacteria bacterium]|jgi:23S rRNA (uracil1939-C5)-methyltransferase|nr:23S rRNA (uracil(1939)-C(5))-methyltransferase RlmD [Gammaproteobacteria bacterium]MBT3721999.1 23S rRNA (uracil(1939)-C(5))-methyltransferase RlmD [Gammaproteobacteria bacterium]MBT4196804.1 23S rRNA (uracil(1939)-C(5))-methyltransferase RlmD [Gammaproteobacteria bacterium]MBT4449123.1 23S rRNA (uracil(1939)-C(5))-methyltransferase RlmD [Gammaproteobacteria bacterium]MBT4862288.1 23S rRNA (uracil(1939)-C(5))-methyltransferase RlmD [Gammaproteobacteria bacterium]